MDVAATTESSLSTGADAVALPLFDGEELATALPDTGLRALVDSGEARPTYKHVAHTHIDGRRAILVGLGARRDLTPERARVAAALGLRRARKLGATALCWELSEATGEQIAEGLVHGSVLAAYRFDRFRPRREPDSDAPQRLIISCPRDTGAAVARAATVAAAQNRARDLGNRPPNDLTPAALATYAAETAERLDGLDVLALGGAQIRELGMGAFAAVAQGSDQDPRLIALRYDGGAADAPRLGLVGKAVTFDSGGLWLKPNASMVPMKFDMAGGAAVIEAIAALAELRAPVNVLGVVGATENMISGSAMRPGDIVTAFDGTTVEINNTDAEGRLVLADCIAYARREGCAALVDIATLTGGVVVALGSAYAGLMANDDGLAARVLESGERAGELVWRLPLHPEYAEMIKGRYAQISNRTERREASAITAAEFLHHFAGDSPWAHLDIAGVGDNGHRPYLDRGGTGFGVRLLTELALSFSAAA
ncbi:MAG TPA: leucyl aminopeptidase [Solirubrobacteraceae bacterium]|nr:leucyl aminopeptidase [Solirubrobacteraceae bacterium]